MSIPQTRKLFHHVKVVVPVGKVVFRLIVWFCTKGSEKYAKTKEVARRKSLNCLLKAIVWQLLSPHASINLESIVGIGFVDF